MPSHATAGALSAALRCGPMFIARSYGKPSLRDFGCFGMMCKVIRFHRNASVILCARRGEVSPVRPLEGFRIADIGSGGGLLSEVYPPQPFHHCTSPHTFDQRCLLGTQQSNSHHLQCESVSRMTQGAKRGESRYRCKRGVSAVFGAPGGQRDGGGRQPRGHLCGTAAPAGGQQLAAAPAVPTGHRGRAAGPRYSTERARPQHAGRGLIGRLHQTI